MRCPGVMEITHDKRPSGDRAEPVSAGRRGGWSLFIAGFEVLSESEL